MFSKFHIFIQANVYVCNVYLSMHVYAYCVLPVLHIPLEADATALVEHMAGAVGETLLALHGTRTVRQPRDPAYFLVSK